MNIKSAILALSLMLVAAPTAQAFQYDLDRCDTKDDCELNSPLGGSDGLGGECGGEVDMQCNTYMQYCSPNDPSQYPGPNCEDGQWQTQRGFCEVYTPASKTFGGCVTMNGGYDTLGGNDGLGGECGGEVDVSCYGSSRYCSPNQPGGDGGFNCSNGMWISYRTYCEVYTPRGCYSLSAAF